MLVALVVLLDGCLILGQLFLIAADLIRCQSNLVLGYKLTILGCLASLRVSFALKSCLHILRGFNVHFKLLFN